MPLKLIPPGRRKGYRFWYAVGTVAGQRFERSLETLDAETAKQRKAKLEAALWDVAEQSGQPMTHLFAQFILYGAALVALETVLWGLL